MTIELGGNIVLVGFKVLDNSNLVVVKKIIGTYVRGITNKSSDFKKMTVTMKEVHHSQEGHSIYQLNAKLEMNDMINAESEDRNLFTALADVLRKIEKQII